MTPTAPYDPSTDSTVQPVYLLWDAGSLVGAYTNPDAAETDRQMLLADDSDCRVEVDNIAAHSQPWLREREQTSVVDRGCDRVLRRIFPEHHNAV